MVWNLIALLSILPLALPVLLPPLLGEGPWDLAGASRFGLVLLPWLAFAGLPARPVRPARSQRAASPWYPVALALPPLALAAGLDHASGLLRLTWEGGGAVLLGGPLVVFLWCLSTRATLGRRAATQLQAILWLLLVPLTAALHVALFWAPVPLEDAAQPGALVDWLARLNPLVWCSRWCGADGDLGAAAGALPILLGVTLAGLGSVRALAARGDGREERET